MEDFRCVLGFRLEGVGFLGEIIKAPPVWVREFRVFFGGNLEGNLFKKINTGSEGSLKNAILLDPTTILAILPRSHSFSIL